MKCFKINYLKSTPYRNSLKIVHFEKHDMLNSYDYILYL